MKRSIKLLVVLCGITLMSVFMLSSTAIAEEGTCYLKADRDVYLEVYDWDEDGNRGGILWKGRLNEDKTIMLKAPHGLFSYDYNDRPDEDQPLSSAEQRMCNGNETIGVP